MKKQSKKQKPQPKQPAAPAEIPARRRRGEPIPPDLQRQVAEAFRSAFARLDTVEDMTLEEVAAQQAAAVTVGKQAVGGAQKQRDDYAARPCSYYKRPGHRPDKPALREDVQSCVGDPEYWLENGKFNWTEACQAVAQESCWSLGIVKDSARDLKGLRRTGKKAAAADAGQPVDAGTQEYRQRRDARLRLDAEKVAEERRRNEMEAKDEKKRQAKK